MIGREQPSITPVATGTGRKEPAKTLQTVICGGTSKSTEDDQIPSESGLHTVTSGGASPGISLELPPFEIIYKRSQLEEYASIAAPTPRSGEFALTTEQ